MRDQAEPVHGHENAVDANEGQPEMDFAERLVQSAAKHFGESEKQGAENGQRRCDSHDEVEMAGDKIVADGSGGKIVGGQENPRKAAREKKRNESDSEKHGGVELDARVPERAEPTHPENCGRQSERRSQQRKDQRRKRIHAAREHVLAPNAKAEEAHGAQRQNHKAFLPNRLAGKRGNEMRDQAKARKHGDVDFGLREKPEKALPENGNG